MIGIYKITSPTGKSYIGQSVEIEKRLMYHKGMYGVKQPALHNSFKKYGFKAHCIEILIECSESQLNDYEEYFIDYFNTLSPNGLNLNTGGSNGRPSPETRIKISIAGKGRKMSDENKGKIVAALKGKPKSDEHRRKLSEFNKGKKLSDEHRAKMSKAHTSVPRTDDVKAKISEGLRIMHRKRKNGIELSFGVIDEFTK